MVAGDEGNPKNKKKPKKKRKNSKERKEEMLRLFFNSVTKFLYNSGATNNKAQVNVYQIGSGKWK